MSSFASMWLYHTCFSSTLEPAMLMGRVRDMVRPQPAFSQELREGFGWRAPGTPPFIGSVASDTFLIRRDIRYRNSFLPRIRGSVSAASGGSSVRLVMQLHPIVLGFMIVWLASASLIGAGMLVRPDRAEAGIAGAFLLFGLVLSAAGFYPEARKAARILEGALSHPAGGTGTT